MSFQDNFRPRNNSKPRQQSKGICKSGTVTALGLNLQKPECEHSREIKNKSQMENKKCIA